MGAVLRRSAASGRVTSEGNKHAGIEDTNKSAVAGISRQCGYDAGKTLLISRGSDCRRRPSRFSRRVDIRLGQAVARLHPLGRRRIAAAKWMNESTLATMGGAPAGYDAAVYGRDFKIFHAFVKRAVPDMLIIGPSLVGETTGDWGVAFGYNRVCADGSQPR